MARVELLATVDKIVSSNLQPATGASVLVKLRSTGNPVTVYAAETGGTTVSNPLVTDANGRVNGWVDEASLVLAVSGSGITSYNQPYEAARADQIVSIDGSRVQAGTLPGTAIADNSIPNTKLAAGAVLGKHLAESAMPLGTIIAWWQPSKPGGGYTIPSGWAVCNGQTLLAGTHDFAGGGSVVLPNLINGVPRGTDPATAYAAASSISSPGGMNAASGSNVVDISHVHNINHYHLIPAHSHQLQDHSHYMSHSHGAYVPDHAHGIPPQKFNVGSGSVATCLGGGNTYGFGGVGIGTDGGNRSYTDGVAQGTLSTINQSGGTNSNWLSDSGFGANSASAGNTQHDNRPAGVGVIYLIKHRNTV
jgi:hypothetical protein